MKLSIKDFFSKYDQIRFENHFHIIETGGNSGLVNLGQVASNKYSKNAKKARDYYKEYFSSEAVAVS